MASALLLLVLGIALAALARRCRLWLQGRPDPNLRSVDRLAHGLAQVPRRYLIDVHRVVARRPSTAAMHVLAAGGFVVALVAVLLVDVPGGPGDGIALAATAGLAAMLAGAGLDLARRRKADGQLSGGAYALVPWMLAGFALTFLVAVSPRLLPVPPIDWTSPPGLSFAALCLAASLALVGGLALGPMRHAALGALHLAFHPRPDRFKRHSPVGETPACELEAPVLGAGTIADFTWTRLLSFDACVQCGRCESVCPAFAAGQPLNPKALICDLAAAAGAPEPYAGEPHPGLDWPAAATAGGVLVGARGFIAPETLWSCTTCGACVAACPMLIEHVDAVVELRRHETLERGALPASLATAVEQARVGGSPSGKRAAERYEWAVALGVRVLGIGERADVLLWLGEGAFDERHRAVLRALVALLRRAGVDFAILGEAEKDCGDLACRAGDEHAFAALARANIAALRQRSFRLVVSADPHVVHTIANEYPRLGAAFQCQHHSRLLADLVANGRLVVQRPLEASITIHDPCYLARYLGDADALRQLFSGAGTSTREMQRSGANTFCCGGGGGSPYADVPGKMRIADLRMDQIRATGAEIAAVACPNCMTMLEGASGTRPRLRDVAELLLQAVEGNP